MQQHHFLEPFLESFPVVPLFPITVLVDSILGGREGGYRVLDNYEKKLRLQWYVLYLDAEMVWKEEHAIN